MPHKKFRCPIYGVTVYLVWGEYKYLANFLKTRYNSTYPDTCPELGCVVEETEPKKKVSHFILYTVNKDYKNNPKKDEILVHETFHLTKKIFNWVGIDLCDESEEAWTHCQEYWYKIFKNTLK